METKLVQKNGLKWVEIRESVGGCNIQIFVSKNGWLNKNEYAGEANKPKKSYFSKDVSAYNVRWSQNGSAYLTFKQLDDLNMAIEQAKEML